MNILDNPMILSIAFHPRKSEPHQSSILNCIDGTIPINDENKIINIGYRFIPYINNNENTNNELNQKESIILVHFHGNAELASDLEHYIDLFHEYHIGVLAFDYRGYGWSDGNPLLTKLTYDAEQIMENIDNIFQNHSIHNPKLFLHGRSIGTILSVHIANKFSNRFYGIILESGLTKLTEIPLVQQLALMIPQGQALISMMPDIFQQEQKLNECELPLLVIHGEQDNIAPISHGKALYNASNSNKKEIYELERCGHNDLLQTYNDIYMLSIKSFIDRVFGNDDTFETISLSNLVKSRRDIKYQTSFNIHFINNNNNNNIDNNEDDFTKLLRESDELFNEQKILKKNNEILNNKKIKNQIKLLNNFSETLSNPEELIEIFFRRAKFYYLKKNTNLINECNNILSFKPNHINALYLRIYYYMQNNLYDLALEDYQILKNELINNNQDENINMIDSIILCGILELQEI